MRRRCGSFHWYCNRNNHWQRHRRGLWWWLTYHRRRLRVTNVTCAHIMDFVCVPATHPTFDDSDHQYRHRHPRPRPRPDDRPNRYSVLVSKSGWGRHGMSIEHRIRWRRR
eukprot:COSAG01_NODE_43016_length_434_cov_0.611940_1_plen_109_part_01